MIFVDQDWFEVLFALLLQVLDSLFHLSKLVFLGFVCVLDELYLFFFSLGFLVKNLNSFFNINRSFEQALFYTQNVLLILL